MQVIERCCVIFTQFSKKTRLKITNNSNSAYFLKTEVSVFSHVNSYQKISLEALLENDEDWKTVLQLLRNGIARGVVKPLESFVFER